jgi:hypothetical protein
MINEKYLRIVLRLIPSAIFLCMLACYGVYLYHYKNFDLMQVISYILAIILLLVGGGVIVGVLVVSLTLLVKFFKR